MSTKYSNKNYGKVFKQNKKPFTSLRCVKYSTTETVDSRAIRGEIDSLFTLQ